MHQPDTVDDVQGNGAASTGLLGRDLLVIAGVSVDDAAAPRRDAFEAAFVKRFDIGENRARTSDILRLDQLLSTSELSGSDVVLHAGDHHRNDDPRLRYAGCLRDHADLQDLSLDLAEAGLQRAPPRPVRNQHACRAHQLIDDVTSADQELLDTAV